MRETGTTRNASRPLAALALTLGSVLAAVPLAPAMAQDLDAYRQKGLEAAMKTKGALGGELVKAMEAGGPENAVAFCNTRALPITRDMSEKLGVDVSRVSDQPRNPANAADDEERAIIAAFKDALAAGEQPAPELREHENTVVGYYPIVTNAMCLKCHGEKGVDISAATQAVIDRAYPQDQATGYGEKELRGLFVVRMERAADAALASDPEGSTDE